MTYMYFLIHDVLVRYKRRHASPNVAIFYIQYQLISLHGSLICEFKFYMFLKKLLRGKNTPPSKYENSSLYELLLNKLLYNQSTRDHLQQCFV